jgi:hypothetical protein
MRRFALAALAAAFALPATAAAVPPDADPPGSASAEEAGAACDAPALGWGPLVASDPSGDDWASTRQFPGRPH